VQCRTTIFRQKKTFSDTPTILQQQFFGGKGEGKCSFALPRPWRHWLGVLVNESEELDICDEFDDFDLSAADRLFQGRLHIFLQTVGVQRVIIDVIITGIFIVIVIVVVNRCSLAIVVVLTLLSRIRLCRRCPAPPTLNNIDDDTAL